MQKKSILLIDNYDSFTFNLEHLIEETEQVKLTVKRNDEDFLSDLKKDLYDGVVIGPGPGSPEDKNYFGHNNTVILEYGTKGLPILGVCLGFQGIYQAFGGSLKVATLPMHGKTSLLDIKEEGTILKNISNQIKVMRYHSIITDLGEPIPDCFLLNAYTSSPQESIDVNGKELMSIEHKQYPIFGVQFHPESFATEFGKKMIENFLDVLIRKT